MNPVSLSVRTIFECFDPLTFDEKLDLVELRFLKKKKKKKKDKDKVSKSKSDPKISLRYWEIIRATVSHLVEYFTPKMPHSTRSVDVFTVRDLQWELNPQLLAVLVPCWIH